MQKNNQNISTEKYTQMLAANKNKADGKILVGVEISAPNEIPASVEILAELKKQAAHLLFRLGGSPTADFSLVPLMSMFSSSLM
jgi:hypothetical protein